MKSRIVKTVAAGSLMLAGGVAGYVFAQAAAPQAPPRVIETELQTVDLGKHFAAMQGKRMLLAHAVIEPGAKGTLHSHQGWPEVVYILKGVLTEHQGGVATDFGPGESFVSNPDTRTPHQIENRTSAPVEAILVEIPNR